MTKIKEFEEYTISKEGVVYSLKNNKKLKPWINGKGYLQVRLYKDGKGYDKRVHRLVAETYIKNKENKEQVNHIDGNKLNNNVNNLEWVTNSENQKHAFQTGIHKKDPEKCNLSKLTKIQVDEIRKKYKPRKVTHQMLANEYGVNRRTIENIINKKSWR